MLVCASSSAMIHVSNIVSSSPALTIIIMINIAIRATYYIFCYRNRNWYSPDLMQFGFPFFFSNNPILSSICKLPIRSEITIVYSKTQKKFPLLLYVFFSYLLIQISLRQMNTATTASPNGLKIALFNYDFFFCLINSIRVSLKSSSHEFFRHATCVNIAWHFYRSSQLYFFKNGRPLHFVICFFLIEEN